jgi:TonB family protein
MLGGLPAAQVEAILLHELAHVRRGDYLVNVLQRFVEGALFYHPAVWWISTVMRSERENCCDDAVIAITANPHDYAVALTTLENNRSAPELAVSAQGGNLVKRVRRLLYPTTPQHGRMPLLAATILLLTFTTVLLAWQPPSQRTPAPAAQGTAITSRYDRWLNEDVTYIISDRERAAYKALTTDEERVKFVEQFWLRRDPTPGTPENEFKEEHYRRIAYANEHFAADEPGWKTDRGRIYITFGPPDELESHPSGGPDSAAPSEKWLYRHIDGIGDRVIIEFTDVNRTGDYRMTMDPNPGKNAAVFVPGNAYQEPFQKSGSPEAIRVPAQRQQENLIMKVDPVYPPLALRDRVEGVVRLRIVVGKDGRVSSVNLVSGHPVLAPAATEAVGQWVYKPTLLNGEPVEVTTEVEVTFTLDK